MPPKPNIGDWPITSCRRAKGWPRRAKSPGSWSPGHPCCFRQSNSCCAIRRWSRNTKLSICTIRSTPFSAWCARTTSRKEPARSAKSASLVGPGADGHRILHCRECSTPPPFLVRRIAGRRALRTGGGRGTDGITQQIRQFVRVVMELLRIGCVLTHEFDGHRERACHIFILGESIIVEVQLIVQRASLEHLSLQRDADRNLLFLAHFQYPDFIP